MLFARPPWTQRCAGETLAPYASLPFDAAAAAAYANIRHELETTGNIAGPNDLMIAAIAPANSLILVTHNTAELDQKRRTLAVPRTVWSTVPRRLGDAGADVLDFQVGEVE